MITKRRPTFIFSAWGFSFLFSKQPLWTSKQEGHKDLRVMAWETTRAIHNQLDPVSGPLTYGPLCLSSQPSWLPAPHTPVDPNFTHNKCEEHTSVFTTPHSRRLKRIRVRVLGWAHFLHTCFLKAMML